MNTASLPGTLTCLLIQLWKEPYTDLLHNLTTPLTVTMTCKWLRDCKSASVYAWTFVLCTSLEVINEGQEHPLHPEEAFTTLSAAHFHFSQNLDRSQGPLDKIAGPAVAGQLPYPLWPRQPDCFLQEPTLSRQSLRATNPCRDSSIQESQSSRSHCDQWGWLSPWSLTPLNK